MTFQQRPLLHNAENGNQSKFREETGVSGGFIQRRETPYRSWGEMMEVLARQTLNSPRRTSLTWTDLSAEPEAASAMSLVRKGRGKGMDSRDTGGGDSG